MLFTNNGKFLKNNGLLLSGSKPGPALPPYTLRLRFKDGTTPTFAKGTGVLFDATNNIWDLTYENSDWLNLLYAQPNLLEVIEANTSNVTNMRMLFYNCMSLITVPLFDTSNVTNMDSMFRSCTSLTSVPLFDTSNASNMNSMFRGCSKVESGALALYQQASSQSKPPLSHSRTFTNCGIDTQTGAEELAQIPNDWK